MLIQKRFVAALTALLFAVGLGAQDFHINASGYFNKDGVDVMAFNDFYPEGHQGGISVLMNGHRAHPAGLPGAARLPVPVAAGGICDGRRLVTLYVPGAGGKGPAHTLNWTENFPFSSLTM